MGQIIRPLPICCAVLLLLVPLAWADFDAGVAAYKAGDYSTALKEFRASAEQGNAKAQVGLGGLYYKGLGIPQDYSQAALWNRKAAAQGDAKAQFNLGLMYEGGHGVPQDYTQAARWYRLAAEQGNISAQYNLGVSYGNGQGVSKNYVQAYMWADLAAMKGDKDASKMRGELAALMAPAQIAEAQKLTREWKPKK